MTPTFVPRRRVIESDVCIIGSGISAAMVADKLARTHVASIVVVEAGADIPPLARRAALRQRFRDYDENPWPNDHLDGYEVEGPLQSRSMCVGGLAMHWGGVTPRFSPEDFRLKSLYGVGSDWPISYDDLEPHYVEAEELLGVAGQQGPRDMDPRSKPFPMPMLPLTYNLGLLKEWAAKAGITMWSQPSAKNSVPYGGRAQCCRNDTCTPICPIGAKYSPDFTWNALRRAQRVRLVTRTIVRRLEVDEKDRVVRAVAVARDAPGTEVELRAKQFVVAGGYVWSSHLLLASRGARHDSGLANSSGLVGKYLTGHRNVQAFVRVPMKLYPGINEQHSLVTKQFMRVKPRDDGKYLRHDLRIWESSSGQGARLRDDAGNLLLGDEILADWRKRTEQGVARLRAYYDVIPARESQLTLDSKRQTPWGDPLPRLEFRDAPESASVRAWTEDTLRGVFAGIARAAGGEVMRTVSDPFQDHPAGGCRMGSDPGNSVTDGWGRTHDHENLFVVGAPTCVSGSCANATLTFCALSLRSAEEIGKSFPGRSAS
ncbi:MAG TPA: GMC family oxidoreductase [Gemmatimonadaceae bacterium]|nr:GMC family oxidoreductase [Gemmatimonadaceae bacterium]